MAQTNGNGHTRVVVLEDRPVGELFQELAQDARNLVTLELELAKTEVSQKASEAGKDAGFIAAGGFVIYAGFLAIMLAVVLVLANFIAPWLSALIVGVVVALIGYLVLRKGMNGLKKGLAPQQTIETLKEDREWVQEQVR